MHASVLDRETLDRVVARSVTIRSHRLGDGLIVQLSGVLDAQATPAMRTALLGRLPAGCQDVLVDGGAVTHCDDDAMAVLVAAGSWARAAGCRFALTAASPAIATSIEELGLGSVLPSLAPPAALTPRH